MSELFDAEAAFTQAFQKQLDEYPDADWMISGRATKANPVGEDADWWRANGPIMVQRWMEWDQGSPWEIWIAPDGRPGIELEIMVKVDAYQPIKMFIDRVYATAPNNQRPVILDIKTGTREPDSHGQLGIYKVGVELFYPEVQIAGGCYWMARTGLATSVMTLHQYTPALFSEYMRRLRIARQTGVFIPNPSNMCKGCKVNEHCAIYGGSNAQADPDYRLMGGN
jgi:hypothetical protein